ncbi:unnamed protein product [Soboliphyme baturini]|uniref:6PF2K domain-containing protein n=1 Tax=Soboliphyme baturini TaxID=241478 RepID=A0A183IT61_9BILA|nr:unnamed protein product [Soboliphyme baturini]
MLGNIQEVLQDFALSQRSEAVQEEHVQRLIELCRMDYETLDPVADNDLSFIKVVNAGSSFLVQNIKGHLMSRVVYFLMNIHLRPRTIYLTRHGESEYNKLERLGGDSPLSRRGIEYAKKLAEYFEVEEVPDLQVWCSQKIRAVQTASFLSRYTACIESWKDLNELDGGICDGLTYDEIKARYPQQFWARRNDKYNYRYPSGEVRWLTHA